jgi:hypothetical protein
MKHHRFAILNGAILLMFGASPFFAGEGPLARVLFVALFVAILMVAVYAVDQRRLARNVVAPLAVLTGIAQIVGLFRGEAVVFVVFHALGIAVLLSVILLLLGRLFSVTPANYETINAALCVYLLMGILWAIAYSLTEALSPGSFAYPLAGDATGFMRIGREYGGIPLYYSIVTMTTLGYGDIVPVGTAARTLATLQAMFGQVYLVVLVARLVGLHVAQPPGEEACQKSYTTRCVNADFQERSASR